MPDSSLPASSSSRIPILRGVPGNTDSYKNIIKTEETIENKKMMS